MYTCSLHTDDNVVSKVTSVPIAASTNALAISLAGLVNANMSCRTVKASTLWRYIFVPKIRIVAQ